MSRSVGPVCQVYWFTRSSALAEAIYPVFEYFLRERHCAKCDAALAPEHEVMEAPIKVFEGYAPSPHCPSCPKWLSIDNKAHSVFVSLVLAIEDTAFSF